MNPFTWLESEAVASSQLHPILALYQETFATTEIVFDSSATKGGRSNDVTSCRGDPKECMQAKLHRKLVNEWLGARVTSRFWMFLFVTGGRVLREPLGRAHGLAGRLIRVGRP